MTGEHRQTLPRKPIACALPTREARTRLAAWRGFDADYLLETEDRGTEYVALYARVRDSELRLGRLVDQESVCCSFATWSIERTAHQLRLVVTGTPDALAALSIR
ncbi:MAG: hypothetical protein HY996_04900 [Micrococcales bacterium]|nr:hypothetical protein [Micrococcales bacterium]